MLVRPTDMLARNVLPRLRCARPQVCLQACLTMSCQSMLVICSRPGALKDPVVSFETVMTRSRHTPSKGISFDQVYWNTTFNHVAPAFVPNLSRSLGQAHAPFRVHVPCRKNALARAAVFWCRHANSTCKPLSRHSSVTLVTETVAAAVPPFVHLRMPGMPRCALTSGPSATLSTFSRVFRHSPVLRNQQQQTTVRPRILHLVWCFLHEMLEDMNASVVSTSCSVCNCHNKQLDGSVCSSSSPPPPPLPHPFVNSWGMLCVLHQIRCNLERKVLRPGDEASEFTFGYCKSLAGSVGARMVRDVVVFE